jgi:hypothetical protein
LCNSHKACASVDFDSNTNYCNLVSGYPVCPLIQIHTHNDLCLSLSTLSTLGTQPPARLQCGGWRLLHLRFHRLPLVHLRAAQGAEQQRGMDTR